MQRNLLFSLVLAAIIAIPNAEPQTNFANVPCSAFGGSGTFSNPVNIGLVNRPIVVTNCPGLSSGRGFNVRYYLELLTKPLNGVPTDQSASDGKEGQMNIGSTFIA